MKVLKYILLLLLLIAVSLTVFVATQESKFTIESEKEINLPKSTIFNYIGDLKNWETWHADNPQKSTVDSLRRGKGSALQYGKIRVNTREYFPNDSLTFGIENQSKISAYQFKFVENESGRSLVKLKTSGEMDFWTKLSVLFKGKESVLGKYNHKVLNDINHFLTRELSTVSVQNVGLVLLPETYYIKKHVQSNLNDLGMSIFEAIESLQKFVKNNPDIKVKDNPFSIFSEVDFISGKLSYEVCLPIEEEIFTSAGSDIISGMQPATYGYKTILVGDYSHSDKAWDANAQAVEEYGLTPHDTIRSISVYNTSILDTQKPSEWVTEVITPVNETKLPEKAIPDTMVTSL